MKRSYLVMAALGFTFLTFALTGRSNAYYGIAILFFIAAILARRRFNKKA